VFHHRLSYSAAQYNIAMLPRYPVRSARSAAMKLWLVVCILLPVALPPVHAAPLSNQQLLEEVQRRAWRFFWEKADTRTGLMNDRARNSGVDNYSVASVAATGYGLAAIPVAVEHGWLARDEGLSRARRTVHFLHTMPHQHGWFYHFVEKSTGGRVWKSEVSSIDTGLLLCGALVCGQYFKADAPDVARDVDQLYARLDWQWMLTNGGALPHKQVLAHGWTPEHGFIVYNYDHYCEAILLVLLGLGAPHKPLPPATWDALQREVTKRYEVESLHAGPIFIHEMPLGFFDLHGLRDRLGWDYEVASRNAITIQRRFCQEHIQERKTYAAGFWGLNAGDGPDGYRAYGAPDGPEDGTVSPSGVLAAMTLAPQESATTARAMFDQFGSQIWGDYGFADAFNLDRNWFDADVIGIDLGMALLAIENGRSGLIWKLMQSHPATLRALKAAGFHATEETLPRSLRVLPQNEFNHR